MGETITVAAVGDIDIADLLRPQTAAHGPLWAFEPCLDLLRADILFGNLECVTFQSPWPDEPPNERESFHLSWDEAMGLVQAGFHVLALANNHILDYGPQRALDTIEFCRRHGIAPIGLGATPAEARKPALLRRSGIAVGFLAYVEDVPGLGRRSSPGPAYIHEPTIREDIIGLRRAGADVVVVSLHADMEFADHPAPHRVAMWRRLIDAGADILLGHHPHVPQGIERYHGGLIAYSLGDFVFPVEGDPYLVDNSPWTDKSFVLRIEVNRTGYVSHEIAPVRIVGAGRPVPMTPAEAVPLLQRHERLCRDLADPTVLEQAWDQTAMRWWRTNIEWLSSAAHEHGMDYAARRFLQEMFYDENAPWLTCAIRRMLAGMPQRTWENGHAVQQAVERAARMAAAVHGRSNGKPHAVPVNRAKSHTGGNGRAASQAHARQVDASSQAAGGE